MRTYTAPDHEELKDDEEERRHDNDGKKEEKNQDVKSLNGEMERDQWLMSTYIKCYL